MIETKNVFKKFDSFVAIDNLNCHIPNGCIYGMVGSNGAGKSTFLRLITGVYKPEKGSVLVDGEDVFDNPKVKEKIMFVSDDLFFLKGTNIKKMTRFYKSLFKRFDEEYFNILLKEFRLPADKPIEKFSKGMKRQTAIILALACKPDYYVFDETFDGLDPVVRDLVKKHICKEVLDRKATAIITSHSLRELENLCDQLALLHEGGLVLENDVDNLKTSLYKIQIAFDRETSEEDFRDLDIMSYSKLGSITTIIGRGRINDVKAGLQKMNPVIFDILSLSLEEIFIYEMKNLGYSYDDKMED